MTYINDENLQSVSKRFHNISKYFMNFQKRKCMHETFVIVFISQKRSALTQLHSKKGCSALLRKIWDCHSHISTLLPCVCSNFFHFFLGFDIWILIEIWNKNQQKSLQVSKNNLLAIKRYFWWTFWILTNDYVIY